MSMDNLTLAQSLVSLIRDPRYTPEGAAARVAVVLEQVRSAALTEITQPMAEMAHAGCMVNLGYGPYNWTCSYMTPERDGKNRTGKTPADAVRKTYTDWKATQGEKVPEEEIA